jgi:4-hydroxythreonine-4-phosphate dehydrogenase
VIEQLPPVKPGLRIAVTMGDPAGIGPEIVAACLVVPTAGVSAFVVGDVDVMRRAVAAHDPNWSVRAISAPADMVALAQTVDVLPAGVALPADLPIGKVAAIAGRASFDYVARAIDLAQAGAIDAVVTAPINKAAWHAAGITFPGHTELLAERCGIDDFAMMLFNDELKVVLLSIHVPLRLAVDLVTVERELRIIRLADKALRDMGVVRPRVAVAGLNPHAGEGGLFGTEDHTIIADAIAQARADGIDATGPWPGDTVFMRARRGDFDVVVAQYHDQGLIPLKYLGLDTGVNVTLGLPFVRTSVDHGTAFDLAGKGCADASSLRVAIAQAARMCAARQAVKPQVQS